MGLPDILFCNITKTPFSRFQYWIGFLLLFFLVKSIISAPLITEMQPRHGRPGTRVVFKGKDLDSVSNVKFGEAYADWEPLGIIDEEGKNYVFEIHATVPNNATSARPVLTTSFGNVIIPIQFIVQPRIFGFYPHRGRSGMFVTLEGKNFNGVKSVMFGDIHAQFSITAATQIRAVVPMGVIDSKITVSHEESATSADFFKVVGTAPVIDQLDEWIGAPGDDVVIRGVNFIGARYVSFGNVESSFNVVADTQIRAVVPNGSSGSVVIGSASGQVETKEVFHITRSPVITDMFPVIAAPGVRVELRGVNFQEIQSIHIGDVQTAGLSNPSLKQLNFTVPSNAKSGSIKITNQFGESYSKDMLIVTRAPVINSFDPYIAQKGKWVTLRGYNFTSATQVLLGNMALRFAVTAATQIRVDLPLNAKTGKLTVKNAFGSDITLESLTIIDSSPFVTGIDPDRGVAGTKIKLYGRNLDQTIAVEFSGGESADFTVPASTQLDVFVPRNARTGSIKLISKMEEYSTKEFFFMPPRLNSPDTVSAKPGEAIEFNGLNFDGLKSLFIGEKSALFEIVRNDKIRFTVGEDWLGGEIKLIAPGGSYISTNKLAVLPRIDSFEPNIGPAGTLVTIKGSGFHNATLLKFGGGVSEFERESVTQISARVPSNASTGQISIMTPDGETKSEAIFTATAPGDLQMESLLNKRDYRPGQEVEINNRLLFFGPTVSTEVKITNQLPIGVKLIEVEPNPTRMLIDGRTLIYELGQIEPGSEMNFRLKLLPSIKGKFINTINASAFEEDVVPSNNGVTNDFFVYDSNDIQLSISSDAFGRTFTLSWQDLGLPLKVETVSFIPGANWRTLPFEPWTIGNRTFVTLEKFGVQSYFRLRLDLDSD